MNALWALMVLAGIIYGIFFDATFWKIYGVLILLWTIYVNIQKDPRDNHRRKTLLIATWGGKLFCSHFILKTSYNFLSVIYSFLRTK